MFTKILTLLSLIASLNSGIPVEEHSIYMRGMQIVSITPVAEYTYNFECIDSVGLPWSFSGTYEDFYEHNIICCLMDDMGTPCIFDDTILMVNYSGYTTENIPEPIDNSIFDELLTDGSSEGVN